MEAAESPPPGPDDLVDEPTRRLATSLNSRLRDQELRDALAQEGFDGVGRERFANELSKYGLAVVLAWLRSGHMFVKCAEWDCPVRRPPWQHWTDADREDLTSATVFHGLENFRRNALIRAVHGPRREAPA